MTLDKTPIFHWHSLATSIYLNLILLSWSEHISTHSSSSHNTVKSKWLTHTRTDWQILQPRFGLVELSFQLSSCQVANRELFRRRVGSSNIISNTGEAMVWKVHPMPSTPPYKGYSQSNLTWKQWQMYHS